MPSIFLSHNHRDKSFVRRLASSLEREGVVVWVDQAEMGVGDSLVDKISNAIQQVDFIGVVISSNSVDSPWVQKELSLAISREIREKGTVVLPILIDECTLPSSVADKLYADFRNRRSFEAQVNSLLRTMEVKGDITIDWTNEGPRVAGRGVVISPSEANALLEHYKEWVPKFIQQVSDALALGGGAAHPVNACAWRGRERASHQRGSLPDLWLMIDRLVALCGARVCAISASSVPTWLE